MPVDRRCLGDSDACRETLEGEAIRIRKLKVSLLQEDQMYDDRNMLEAFLSTYDVRHIFGHYSTSCIELGSIR